MATEGTFSESWHRVAGRRLRLRTSVRIRRRIFRGERWYVLEDPFSNQFFRLRSGAHEFLARLDGRQTVDDCWKACLEQDPEEAPGQEEVIRLISQLHYANLISGDLPPDAFQVFEKFRKRRQREWKSRLMSILFVRIPLFDPDSFLKRSLPLVSWIFARLPLKFQPLSSKIDQ